MRSLKDLIKPKANRIIVVTKHPALPEVLAEDGIEFHEVIEHIDHPSQIADAHVIGVIPLHLACVAYRVTEIPLKLTVEQKGKVLSKEEIRTAIRAPRTFVVFED
jgi:putative CRISPR-associated protein (TIGR02620 family)